jgi:hypothetical protein
MHNNGRKEEGALIYLDGGKVKFDRILKRIIKLFCSKKTDN